MMMKKFMQGRFLVTSLVRNCSSFRPIPRQTYHQVLLDECGCPRHSDTVFDVLGRISTLSEDEKIRYGPVFCELLGLPKPPKIPTQRRDGENFVVKLIKFDEDNAMDVVHVIASVKLREAPRTLSDLGQQPSLNALDNFPSVIKQGVTKEEANEIIANIEAAGGIAVVEFIEAESQV